MTIVNLDFLISGSIDDGYTIRVIDSPQGRTDEPVAFPLQAARGGISYAGARLAAQLDDVTEPQVTGLALYKALTSATTIQNILAALLPEAAALRLRFQVEPRELRRLPWELLYTDPYGFLCLAASVTRYIGVLGQPVRSLLTQPPLTILLVSASPHGFPELNVDKEIGQIRAALKDEIAAGRVRLIECPDISIEKARATALAKRAHVFHFIGHADFNDGSPVIVFAGGQRHPVLVTTETLGTNLAGIPSLRLAVLNACETAVQGTGAAFVGVAPKLIQRSGLPAVLAMQSKILDSSAVAFSHGFYAALARGESIDRATSEGRLGISNLHSRSSRVEQRREFVVPVLFLRPADAILIDFPRVPITALAPRDAQTPANGWRARIGAMARLYSQIDGWKSLHEILHDLDGALDLIGADLNGSSPAPLERIELAWRQASVKIDALRVFAADAPIAQTPFRQRANGTLTGDPWVVEMVVGGQTFERALSAADERGLRRALRDLRRAVQTHLNTSDKAIVDHLTAFPVESIWTEGSPAPALQTLVETLNQRHCELVAVAHRHDLLQDLIDGFRRVREETRGAPSGWRLESIGRAWDFVRASLIDSRLLPYARANGLLTEQSELSGDAWAVELFTAANRLSAAVEAALDADSPGMIGEAVRLFDRTLNQHFLSTDSSLRSLTAELRQLGAQLSAFVEGNST